MNEKKSRRPRTWSALGDVRRKPSEYEIVTHGVNYTLRDGRGAAFDENPASFANLWMSTYREGSPLAVADWDKFRDPDAMVYRAYVSMQDEEESKVFGVLDKYSDSGAERSLAPEWRQTLLQLFTTTRYPLHATQQIHTYYAQMAPSAYITNAAVFAAGDVLRRVSVASYRARELELAFPGEGFASGERDVWEKHAQWQPARRALEYAMATYDWGESFTAANLVLLPVLDEVLLKQFAQLARANGDEVTWLLLEFLRADSERRDRWSSALAGFAISERAENRAVLQGWIDRWLELAREAAHGLAQLIESAPNSTASADAVVEAAVSKVTDLHASIGLSGASVAVSNK